MPQDALVWIVLIVAAALVIGLAVWKGRGLRVNKGKEGFSIEVERSPDAPRGEPPAGRGRIEVAKGLEIEGAQAGDIAGVKAAGSGEGTDRDIDVAAGARIRNAKVGDIVGVKHTGDAPEDER